MVEWGPDCSSSGWAVELRQIVVDVVGVQDDGLPVVGELEGAAALADPGEGRRVDVHRATRPEKNTQ